MIFIKNKKEGDVKSPYYMVTQGVSVIEESSIPDKCSTTDYVSATERMQHIKQPRRMFIKPGACNVIR